jgi:low temperature requirement protein LtrA
VTIALWTLGVALDLWLVLVVSGDDMLERYTTRLAQLSDREARGRGRLGGPASSRGLARAPERVREVLQAVPVVTDPGHLAERLGLFVIIVLGEGVVQVVDAASDAAPESGLFLAGLASFVLLASIFEVSVQYGFAGVPHLRSGAVPARVGLGLHCIVTGVIATIAVALASVVEHGHEPLGTGPRWLLCGAVAAYFLIGQVVAIVVSGRAKAVRTLWISSAVVVPLLLGVFGAALPASLLTGIIALLVVGQVLVESRGQSNLDDTTPDAGSAGPAAAG